MILLAAFSIFIAEGCLTLSQPKKPLSAYFSKQATVIDVPVIYQDDKKSCGVAAIDMLTWYYGVILNKDLRERLLDEAKQNKSISGKTLKEVLEKVGYRVAVFPGTLDYELTGLYHHLKKGNPLIVLISSEKNQIGHYCLVSGFDPKTDLIILTDPKKGIYGLSTHDFKKHWEKMGSFTLLASPKTDLFQQINKAKSP